MDRSGTSATSGWSDGDIGPVGGGSEASFGWWMVRRVAARQRSFGSRPRVRRVLIRSGRSPRRSLHHPGVRLGGGGLRSPTSGGRFTTPIHRTRAAGRGPSGPRPSAEPSGEAVAARMQRRHVRQQRQSRSRRGTVRHRSREGDGRTGSLQRRPSGWRWSTHGQISKPGHLLREVPAWVGDRDWSAA